MFDTLSDRLNTVFDRLRGRGALSEADVREAMREVRIALLEADVALPVARDFIGRVTEKAVGQQVLRSVTPGQQVVKIVNDELVAMLGGDEAGEGGAQSAGQAVPLNLDARPPVVIMMVGLQGSGKTTSTAKIAKLLKEKQGKKAMMASLDVNRPAAQEQLKVLGEQVGVATLPIVQGQQPVDIARRALESARLQAVDVLLLDTAGRLHVDEALMAEMKAVASVSAPQEVLLVVDALTGQDAVNVAQSFSGVVPLTGVVLTRMDGDARGGAALSMRAVTGKPIKFAGTGEKLDAIEPFHPGRVAGRILGMGDVVSLVERAAQVVEKEEADKLAERMMKGQFDMNDLRTQLMQMQKMGGLGMLAGMMPGMKKAKQAMQASGVDDKVLVHMDAIIGSMTKAERAKPEVMNAKRKKRVAAGSGTSVQDVNKLLKMHQEMGRAMKQIRKMGGLKGLGALLGGGGGLGGLGGAGGFRGGGGGGGRGMPPQVVGEATGVVKFFNGQKGFGFIVRDDGGEDVFVHISAVEQAGLTGLAEGQPLGFTLVDRGGRVSATELKIDGEPMPVTDGGAPRDRDAAPRAGGGMGGPQRQLTGERASGTVKFFNAMKGFGFIQRDDGQPDAFVHISAVERAGMPTLNEGDKLEFELEVDRRGKHAAVNLQPKG